MIVSLLLEVKGECSKVDYNRLLNLVMIENRKRCYLE